MRDETKRTIHLFYDNTAQFAPFTQGWYNRCSTPYCTNYPAYHIIIYGRRYITFAKCEECGRKYAAKHGLQLPGEEE